MSRKFFVATFGCRTNQADSAAIREDFLDAELEETFSFQEADVIVVNSCTVTHRSDQQVRQLVRKLRRGNRGARLLVTGCYAQREPEALARIRGVDAVLGNTRKSQLVQLSSGFHEERPAQILHDGFDKVRSIDLATATHFGGRTRPFVKIQDGCDAKCSYCIIPGVRGPSRSVPPQQILQHVRNLVSLGFREVVLTGIHIGTYGVHLRPRFPLWKLLQEMLQIEGLGQIRVSSIEPMELSREVIRLASENRDRIAPHFHICLQSGCDRTLRRMLRPYDTARFAAIVKEIREEIPDAGIGTDVICGFPGETEEDNQESFDFVARMPFTYLHVFPYSDRSGTRASKFPDKVHPDAIRERCAQFRKLSKKRQCEFRRSFRGNTLRALSLDEERDGTWECLTSNYLKAIVPNDIGPNQLFDARVTGEKAGMLVLEAVRYMN